MQSFADNDGDRVYRACAYASLMHFADVAFVGITGTCFRNYTAFTKRIQQRSSHDVFTNGFAYGWGKCMDNMWFRTNGFGCLHSFLENQSVIFVALGGSHSLILTECGQLYSLGGNIHGQLGIGSWGSAITTPALVKGTRFSQIACKGVNHSMALSYDGSIYLWGCNDTSQLGSGMKSKKSKSIPTRIQYNGDLPKCIVTGGKECTGFCFVVTHSGTTYSWGNNDHGELGIGDRKQRAAPQRVTSLTDITAIACGVTHSISLDKNGHLYAWGSGILLPTRITCSEPSIQIKSIECGAKNSYFVSDQGHLYAMKLGDNKFQMIEQDVQSVSAFKNTIILKRSGEVIFCGQVSGIEESFSKVGNNRWRLRHGLKGVFCAAGNNQFCVLSTCKIVRNKLIEIGVVEKLIVIVSIALFCVIVMWLIQ